MYCNESRRGKNVIGRPICPMLHDSSLNQALIILPSIKHSKKKNKRLVRCSPVQKIYSPFKFQITKNFYANNHVQYTKSLFVYFVKSYGYCYHVNINQIIVILPRVQKTDWFVKSVILKCTRYHCSE